MRFLNEVKTDAAPDLHRICPRRLLEPVALLLQKGRGSEIPARCAENGQEFLGPGADGAAGISQLYLRTHLPKFDQETGIPPGPAQGSMVFLLDRRHHADDVGYVLEHLPPAVERLRSFSPVWRQKMAAA